jgi:hypothetical protein
MDTPAWRYGLACAVGLATARYRFPRPYSTTRATGSAMSTTRAWQRI